MSGAAGMRVLFAIGSLGGGGAERQMLNYLRHLDRRRFSPLLYLTERQGELLDAVPDDVEVQSFTARCSTAGWYFPGRIRRRQIEDLAAVLEEQRIDVLCAVTFHLALISASSVDRRPTPWLAVEMADPRYDFDVQVRRFRWLKRRLLRRAYHHAGNCVAVSQGVRDGLVERYRIPPHRVVVVPNCVDVAEVDRRAALPAPVLGAERFHIACVGRLHVQKGHRHLLEAIASLVHDRGLQQIHLHLLGQGPLDKELRAFVRQLGIADHITFAGYVPNPHAYVRQCQLFCLPSLFEGLPLALLEAMVCRVPVIATDCPSGPGEILDRGHFGRLVPPARSDCLADAIRDAMANESETRRLVEDARERVCRDYNVSAVVPQFQQLLSAIASR